MALALLALASCGAGDASRRTVYDAQADVDVAAWQWTDGLAFDVEVGLGGRDRLVAGRAYGMTLSVRHTSDFAYRQLPLLATVERIGAPADEAVDGGLHAASSGDAFVPVATPGVAVEYPVATPGVSVDRPSTPPNVAVDHPSASLQTFRIDVPLAVGDTWVGATWGSLVEAEYVVTGAEVRFPEPGRYRLVVTPRLADVDPDRQPADDILRGIVSLGLALHE